MADEFIPFTPVFGTTPGDPDSIYVLQADGSKSIVGQYLLDSANVIIGALGKNGVRIPATVFEQITAGTAQANKAAVLGATNNLDILNVAALAATTSVAVGGGTLMTKIVAYAAVIDPASVAAATTAEQLFTVTGIATTDKLFINKPTVTAGLGIANVRASATNQIGITFVNATAGAIDAVSETYTIIAMRS